MCEIDHRTPFVCELAVNKHRLTDLLQMKAHNPMIMNDRGKTTDLETLKKLGER
jgi:hypothetical protein